MCIRVITGRAAEVLPRPDLLQSVYTLRRDGRIESRWRLGLRAARSWGVPFTPSSTVIARGARGESPTSPDH